MLDFERPKNSQEAPKSAQEAPKKRPERPREAHETPKRGRETPNPLQNRAWQDPERVLDAFGSVRGARRGPILEKAFSEASANDVRMLFFDDSEKREP